MANFNLADYETVEQRIKRFYADNPDGRIITENISTEFDRQNKTWVVRAVVFLSKEDQGNYNAKSTGLAFEIDGTGGANRTSALENAETSAIGRALANANYSGNMRATREEMEKVARADAKRETRDWPQMIASLTNKSDARALYSSAQKMKADQSILDQIEARAAALEE